jgi:hypothetical protein
MVKQNSNLNNDVSSFLDALDHPFRKEIEQLRMHILLSDKQLTENIKWNGPNYSIGEEDRITMRIHPAKNQAQLILHRGSKKLTQPKDQMITDASKLLVWKENDRAIATFKSMQEIEDAKDALKIIIQAWIKATK